MSGDGVSRPWQQYGTHCCGNLLRSPVWSVQLILEALYDSAQHTCRHECIGFGIVTRWHERIGFGSVTRWHECIGFGSLTRWHECIGYGSVTCWHLHDCQLCCLVWLQGILGLILDDFIRHSASCSVRIHLQVRHYCLDMDTGMHVFQCLSTLDICPQCH